MVKKNIILAIAFNFFIFAYLLSFVSSSVTFGNASANQSYSISKVYSSNESLNGWLNMSIKNESTNSLIKMNISGNGISLNKEISLLELLKKPVNSQVSYSCYPTKDCKDFYTTNNPASSKEKDLTGESTETSFAFVITTPPSSLLTNISSFSLNVSSNNEKSDLPPLKIDIFNDKIIDWQSNIGVTNVYGNENYGCFEADKSEGYAEFGNTLNAYCEKIELGESPGLMLGAVVNGTKKASFNLTVINNNEENKRTASCLATTNGEDEIFCNVSYPTFKDEEYYVCVIPKDNNATNYKIRYEFNEACGFSILSDELQEGNLDFEIYARPQKYETIGSFILNSTSIKNINPSTDIESKIQEYIEDEYNRNCSKGCIIPIKFITNGNQKLIINSLNLGFKAGVQSSTDKIYNLNIEHANITTNSYQKISLNNVGFNVPITGVSKNYTLRMYFNKDIILSKIISVLISNDALFWVYPTIVPVNYSNQFELGINDTRGINSYSWNFGDGSPELQTTTPKATHSYSSLGNYTILIKARDISNKEYSKSFKVEVVSAASALPVMFNEKEEKLNKIISQFNSMSLNNFEKSEIYKILKINENKNIISLIKSRINSSNITSNEYALYLSNLSTMNIPDSVYIKSQTQVPIPIYPQKSQIDPALINEDYNSSNLEEYQDAIYDWQTINKKVYLTFKEINKMVDNQDYLIEKFYTLRIENQDNNTLNSTLILKKYDNLIFDGNISYNENNGYVTITIPPETTTISFATTQNIDSLNFNAIISPALSELDVQTPVPVEVKDNTNLIILISGIIIVIGIITWIILANWYKNKYEKHLFKDQNQLYNLILFIEAERKRGKKEREIHTELKKVGWTNEQIRYASKKHANKNTGMPLST
jgi:hypothetical protein